MEGGEADAPPGGARYGAGAFHHGARRVFDEISFLLDDARTALVGENGAGKSTLLRCLTGELKLNRGKLIRSRGLRIGWLPQETGRPDRGASTLPLPSTCICDRLLHVPQPVLAEE
ncbi:MAG: ATP-binding cassette domain-containing protein [Caulobacteraceae bacterium]